MNEAHILASMTVTEFRAFRKAYAILVRAGIGRDYAINMLTEALDRQRQEIQRYRHERRLSA